MRVTTKSAVADEPIEPEGEGALPASTPGALRSLLSGLAYSLGFTVQRAIAFLMLPVYTAVLSPAEYGVLGLLVAASTGFGILVSVGLDTAIVRNYFQLASEPERRERFLESVWRFLIWFPLAASVAVSALVWPFLDSSGRVHGIDVFLALAGSALNIGATILPLAVLRARHDVRGYVLMTVVFATATTGLTVLFVVAFGMGVRGWFLAALVSNALLLFAATRVVPWRRTEGFAGDLVKGAVIFSLPLLPHFVSHWALQLADRGVIAGMVSPDELGIYTLAANVASIVMLLVMALNQGFGPTYARAGAESGMEDELRRVVALQIACVVAITFSAAVVAPPALQLVTTDAFHGAFELIPWLVLGYGFLGVYFVPMNGATLAAGRRGLAWVATAVSACANIALLIIFVPEYGIEAAAVSSALGYLILLVLLAAWAHSGENPVVYPWEKIVPIVLAAVLLYGVAVELRPAEPIAGVAVGLAFVLGFVVIGALVGFRSEFRQVLGRLRSSGQEATSQ